MVYPNEKDEDYVKVKLDTQTLAQVKTQLEQIPSALTRLMVWQDLYGMVRDVALKPQDYLQVAETQLSKETNEVIGETVIKNLPTVIYYLPQSNDAEKLTRTTQVSRIEHMLWTRAETAAPGSDWQRIAMDGYTAIAESPEAADHLIGLLNGSTRLKGFDLDIDQRWTMIIHLAALGDARVDAVLEEQKKADPSARGIENALAADAARPNADKKRLWLSKLTDQNDLSYTQKRSVLRTMLPPQQDGLRAQLADDFYKSLPNLVKHQQLGFTTIYARDLLPAICTGASAASLKSFLDAKSADLPMPVVKYLRIGHQEDNRCVSIRSYAANPHKEGASQ